MKENEKKNILIRNATRGIIRDIFNEQNLIEERRWGYL